MKLALNQGLSGASSLSGDIDRVLEAERLGYESVWTSESYGAYAGRDATGLGKPLRSILHGRADLPIYLAAIGPKNVALAAELADGWIPTIFSPRRMSIFRGWLDEGFRARGGTPAKFDIMPSCP